MMNEEEDNPSWPAFLIDLDLAIKEDREKPSGAPNKTGTRAFMVIGALYGEKRSFMHDLSPFFGFSSGSAYITLGRMVEVESFQSSNRGTMNIPASWPGLKRGRWITRETSSRWRVSILRHITSH